MRKIIQFLNTHTKIKELILYVFFGGCTTLVNWIVYFPLTNFLSVHFQIANVVAWICAVAFAYITNKKFVFQSKTETAQQTIKEISLFVGARVVSLLLEVAIMQITIEWLHFDANLMKIVTAVITVIFNYLASKLVAFKKTQRRNA